MTVPVGSFFFMGATLGWNMLVSDRTLGGLKGSAGVISRGSAHQVCNGKIRQYGPGVGWCKVGVFEVDVRGVLI
jgi:hypothetical protein